MYKGAKEMVKRCHTFATQAAINIILNRARLHKNTLTSGLSLRAFFHAKDEIGDFVNSQTVFLQISIGDECNSSVFFCDLCNVKIQGHAFVDRRNLPPVFP